MDNPASQEAIGEIRRCARCGHAALILVHAWQQKFAGIRIPNQFLELQCQACGIKVVLHPKTRIRAARVVAYVMIPAIIPSIIFFAIARREERAWTDNPVVKGASQPTAIAATGRVITLDRYRPDVPERRCECSGRARCVAIAHQGTWDHRLGMHHDYRCPSCARTFTIHDVTGVLFASVLASALSAAGTFVILHPPGAAIGAEHSNRWVGIGLVALGVIAWLVFAWRIRGRLTHPLVPRND